MPQDTAKANYVQKILDRYGAMKAHRSLFEITWSEIAKRVLPRQDDFITRQSPGQRREEYIFDSTAQLALPAFASAMESMLTPRTQKWHSLQPLDPVLAEDDEVMTYLELVRDILFRNRYMPGANFASQAYEAYMGLGAFGTGILFIEDGLSKGFRYQTIPLAECFIAEDHQGVVDTVLRRYELTARQAKQKWGDKIPEAIAKCVDKEPDRKFEFIHMVHQNEEGGRFAYKACDVSIEGKVLLAEGGYRTFPYAVSRYTMAPREVYGRSPAWDALADIKTLNEMSKTMLRYGQLVTDPPWITADLDGMAPFAVRPGAVNPGFMGEQGTPLARSLAPEGDPRISLELMDQRRQSINRAFLVTLFQILVDTPQMTATEAMLRAQEKGALLAPTIGRQQSEFLGPLITRELDILAHAGVLPPMPEQLAESGGRLDIVYDSPLSRAQRSEEGVGILRTLEALTPMANIDPTILQVINFEEAARVLAAVNGAPRRVIRSAEEMEAMKQQQVQQQQLATLLEAAPVAADTAKSLAQANSAMAQAPV
jgi:hypothetical protein